jgi:hypothetical protein
MCILRGDDFLTLGRTIYQVVDDPRISDGISDEPVAFAVEGGHAIVYQLRHVETKALLALKVLFPGDQGPEILRNEDLLAQLAPVPGFAACESVYLTRQTHPEDVTRCPDFEYGSLMPWIPDRTWSAVLEDRTNGLDDRTSWQLANDLLVLLSLLERNQVAHCDLSGGNLLVDLRSGRVNLIDFDDVFWPGAPAPKWSVDGTPAYSKPGDRTFRASGDRFGTAVLLAEILCWRDARIRAQVEARALGPTLFTPDECAGIDNEHYREVHLFLSQLHHELGELFAQAWEAPPSQDSCPSVATWRQALAHAQSLATVPFDFRDDIKLHLPARHAPYDRPIAEHVSVPSNGVRLFANPVVGLQSAANHPPLSDPVFDGHATSKSVRATPLGHMAHVPKMPVAAASVWQYAGLMVLLLVIGNWSLILLLFAVALTLLVGLSKP